MTNIVLPPVTNGNNISTLNDNFRKIQESVNNDLLNLDGGNNVMQQDLDMNGNQLLNIGVDVNNPQSLLTVSAGDARYYNVSGDTLTGPMSVNGQVISGLAAAIASTSPVRKSEFDGFVSTQFARDAGQDATITANYNYLKSYIENLVAGVVGGSGFFLQDGAGAVGRTYQDRMRDSVHAKDFGVIGDGTNDDTLKVQAAATYCADTGKVLDIRGLQIVLTDTVNSKPFLIDGGNNTGSITARNMAGKIMFNMSTPATAIGRVWGSVNVNWIVEGADIEAAIISPNNSSQYSTFFLRCRIEGNNCRGTVRNVAATGFAWDFGAKRWFHIGDCDGALLAWNNIQGKFNIQLDPSGQPEETAFQLNANSAILSARINDNNIGPIKTGISVNNRAFLTMHDNDLMACYDGLIWSGTTLFNEPKIHHNNFNAQRFGIDIDGPGAITFEDNTVRRHSSGWKGALVGWVGMRISNCTDLKLNNNSCQADESAGAFPLTNTAFQINSSSLAVVNGNEVGVNSDLGFDLNDCTGFSIDNTRSAQNAAGDILFNLRGNTRRSTIGQYALSSSFTGQPRVKDGTIVDAISMFNQQFVFEATGSTGMAMSRVNAAANNKVWDTVLGTNSIIRRAVSDAGVGTNFELVTRTGTVVDEIQWRATQLRINNAGPIIRAGSGSPEGVVTAPPGSLWLNTTSGGGSYQKVTGTGNTGWVLL
jgi:hypothetical protein